VDHNAKIQDNWQKKMSVHHMYMHCNIAPIKRHAY